MDGERQVSSRGPAPAPRPFAFDDEDLIRPAAASDEGEVPPPPAGSAAPGEAAPAPPPLDLGPVPDVPEGFDADKSAGAPLDLGPVGEPQGSDLPWLADAPRHPARPVAGEPRRRAPAWLAAALVVASLATVGYGGGWLYQRFGSQEAALRAAFLARVPEVSVTEALILAGRLPASLQDDPEVAEVIARLRAQAEVEARHAQVRELLAALPPEPDARLRVCERATALAPDLADAWTQHGLALYAATKADARRRSHLQEAFAQAARSFARAMEVAPHDPRPRLYRALLRVDAFGEEGWSAAAGDLAAAERGPTRRLARALERLHARDPVGAAGVLEDPAEGTLSREERAEVAPLERLLLAEAYLRQGRWEAARVEARNARFGASHSAGPLAVLAEAEALAGDLASARTHADEALALQPGDARALGLRAWLRLEVDLAGRATASGPDLARATGEAALAQALGPEEPWAALAHAHARLAHDPGASGAALQALDAVGGAGEHVAPLQLLRGRLQARVGRLDEAFRSFERVLRVRDEDARALTNLGALRLQKGDLGVALQLIERALRAEPRLAEAWINRGLVRLRAGDVEPALADLGRAVSLAPDLYAPRHFLAAALYDAGQQRDALATLAEAGPAPEAFAADALLLSASCHDALEQREEALAAYEAFVGTAALGHPALPRARLRVAALSGAARLQVSVRLGHRGLDVRGEQGGLVLRGFPAPPEIERDGGRTVIRSPEGEVVLEGVDYTVTVIEEGRAVLVRPE